jgi:hypothetical protein
MSDLQGIADRVEIKALPGEYSDAAMTRDYDRLASLFTPRRRGSDTRGWHPTRRPGGDPRRDRATVPYRACAFD